MKRQIMKSIYAFCTGVMTLVAASSLVVSCYDDAALWEEVENLDDRLTEVEKIKDQLAALTARVDALYTLEFQVSDSNELQYSFDGGKTWVSTGVVLEECTCEIPDPCTCKEVSLVDNGDSVTITVGDQSFTIEKPEEIVFDIRAGKVYFASESTQKIALKTSGVTDVTVMSAPKGWWAEIASDGMLEVTAPDFQATVEDGYWNDDWTEYIEVPATAAAEGYVKVHACGVDGKCMVGKLPVVVSAQPVHISAYNGTAYFNAAGNWPAFFYYGAAPKESFETEVAELLNQMNSRGWADWNANGDQYDPYPTVEASIEELLGAKVEDGKEYVVYALVDDYSKLTYSLEDFIIKYYSPVSVNVTEVEAEKTAYNVTVNIEVSGVDSYVALSFGGFRIDEYTSADYYAEMLATGFEYNLGTKFTQSYTGSVLEIGVNSYEKDSYLPDSDVYLMVLPLDGRPSDEYTVEDVVVKTFKTAPLTAGGSVNATAEQVFTYMNYGTFEVVVDKYSQVAVKVEPSAENWVAFYYTWLDDKEWNLYGGDDALLVDRLLNEWGMTPSDVDFPYYDCLDTDPATTQHFVAFFVDDAGKYGELAKVSATTEELVYSEIMFTEPYETNLTDGVVLKNTTEFMFKPVVEGGTAASYKYIWWNTTDYNPYEEQDDAAMAQTIHFDRDKRAMVVSADELVDGYMYVPNCKYGRKYMVAVLPYDENGAPGKSAAIFNFSSVIELENVITEGAEFDATKPAYTVNLPTVMDELGDGAIYYYEYQDYFEKYLFSYEFNVVIEPKEGTTVSAAFVDTKNYPLGEGAAARASQLWLGSFGSYYTYSVTETFKSSHRYFSSYEDADAPDVWFVISWTDAEGNYYYAEQSLQAELQKLAEKLKLYVHTPYGKQYAFAWTAFGLDEARLDLGVSIDSYCMVGYDLSLMYPDEPEVAGMWMAYLEGAFEIEKTDNTSGKIWLMQVDYVTGELSRGTAIEYSDFTPASVTINCADFAIENAVATLCEEYVTISSQGFAM